MAVSPPHAEQRPPERLVRGEEMPGHQTWSLHRPVTAGDLGREGQIQLVQAARREEVTHQPRSALDQDQFAWTGSAYRAAVVTGFRGKDGDKGSTSQASIVTTNR